MSSLFAQGSLFYDLLVHARSIIEKNLEVTFDPQGPQFHAATSAHTLASCRGNKASGGEPGVRAGGSARGSTQTPFTQWTVGLAHGVPGYQASYFEALAVIVYCADHRGNPKCCGATGCN